MSVLTMAGRKPKPVQPEQDKSDEALDLSPWKLFTKIDPSLRKPFEKYINSREYPPDQARVIERALREFLERQGFWPDK